jgi:hypothetical protein
LFQSQIRQAVTSEFFQADVSWSGPEIDAKHLQGIARDLETEFPVSLKRTARQFLNNILFSVNIENLAVILFLIGIIQLKRNKTRGPFFDPAVLVPA